MIEINKLNIKGLPESFTIGDLNKMAKNLRDINKQTLSKYHKSHLALPEAEFKLTYPKENKKPFAEELVRFIIENE